MYSKSSAFSYDSNFNALRSIGYEPVPPRVSNNITTTNSSNPHPISNLTSLVNMHTFENARANQINLSMYSQSARNMMAKQGYKPGQGLGPSGSGITQPIQAQSNQGRSGLGFNSASDDPPSSATPITVAQAAVPAEESTAASVLSDFVDPLNIITNTAVNASAAAASLSAKPDSSTLSVAQKFNNTASNLQTSNITSGALIGSNVGSLFGPIGTLVGAGVGAMASYNSRQKLSTPSGDIDSSRKDASIY